MMLTPDDLTHDLRSVYAPRTTSSDARSCSAARRRRMARRIHRVTGIQLLDVEFEHGSEEADEALSLGDWEVLATLYLHVADEIEDDGDDEIDGEDEGV